MEIFPVPPKGKAGGPLFEILEPGRPTSTCRDVHWEVLK